MNSTRAQRKAAWSVACLLLPRLPELQQLEVELLEAAIDYWHESTDEQAIRCAELATCFNDKKYWWQATRRAAVWVEQT